MEEAGVTEEASGPFRACGACPAQWATPAVFLRDSDLSLVGLQVTAHAPEANVLIFQHRCGTSVSVLTRRLQFLLSEQEPGAAVRDLYGTEQCRAHCRQLEDWAACDQPCVNARDRRLLQVILDLRRLAGR